MLFYKFPDERKICCRIFIFLNQYSIHYIPQYEGRVLWRGQNTMSVCYRNAVRGTWVDVNVL